MVVGCELRIHRQPTDAALACRVDRQRGEGLCAQDAVLDDPDRTALLGDEDSSVRQEAEVHGRVQARYDDGALEPDEDRLGRPVVAVVEEAELEQAQQTRPGVQMESAAGVTDGDVEPVLPGVGLAGGVHEGAVGIDHHGAVGAFRRPIHQPRGVGVDGVEVALDATVHGEVLCRVVIQGRGLVVEEPVERARFGDGGRRNARALG